MRNLYIIFIRFPFMISDRGPFGGHNLRLIASTCPNRHSSSTYTREETFVLFTRYDNMCVPKELLYIHNNNRWTLCVCSWRRSIISLLFHCECYGCYENGRAHTYFIHILPGSFLLHTSLSHSYKPLRQTMRQI